METDVHSTSDSTFLLNPKQYFVARTGNLILSCRGGGDTIMVFSMLRPINACPMHFCHLSVYL